MDRTLAVILLLWAVPAAAHEETHPKRDRIELQRDGVRLLLEYAVPAGSEAQALRHVFDRDHSGSLDPGETAQLTAYLAWLAGHFAAVAVDGKPLALQQIDQAQAPGAAGDGMDRLAIVVTLWGEAPLREGTHVVLLSDRHKDRRMEVPVTVALNGLRLLGRTVPQPFVYAGHPLELRVMATDGKDPTATGR